MQPPTQFDHDFEAKFPQGQQPTPAEVVKFIAEYPPFVSRINEAVNGYDPDLIGLSLSQVIGGLAIDGQKGDNGRVSVNPT